MAKGALDEVVRWLDRAAVNALYKGRARAAEQVVAELQELGPRWSGKFQILGEFIHRQVLQQAEQGKKEIPFQ
jgi:hypothetical protein